MLASETTKHPKSLQLKTLHRHVWIQRDIRHFLGFDD